VLLLLLLLLLYIGHPYSTMQSVIIISNFSSRSLDLENFVKYYEIEDLRIVFTLKFKIRV